MTSKKRPILLAALCALAAVAAGCGGDDNKTLSYDDTGKKIGELCETVSFDGATGDPANDGPILAEAIPKMEKAIEDIRDLDVDEELKADRDEFTDLSEQQVATFKEAQQAAEAGDKKAYRAAAQKAAPVGKQSDEVASRLGAEGCLDG